MGPIIPITCKYHMPEVTLIRHEAVLTCPRCQARYADSYDPTSRLMRMTLNSIADRVGRVHITLDWIEPNTGRIKSQYQFSNPTFLQSTLKRDGWQVQITNSQPSASAT